MALKKIVQHKETFFWFDCLACDFMSDTYHDEVICKRDSNKHACQLGGAGGIYAKSEKRGKNRVFVGNRGIRKPYGSI